LQKKIKKPIERQMGEMGRAIKIWFDLTKYEFFLEFFENVTIFLNIVTMWRPKKITSLDEFTLKRGKFLMQFLISPSPLSKKLIDCGY